MASPDRGPTDPLALLQALQESPYRFGFFDALRRLDAVHAQRPRTGESSRPSDDHTRFAQAPSLAFAPATLASFAGQTANRPARLEVYFFGLMGPNGPLPLHLTEYARDRIRNSGDATFARFLDLFHHRMLALFYRAWAVAQPAVNFDRPPQDRFAGYVGSLCGLGLPALRDRDAMPDLAKQYFAGLLAAQSRHAEGLETMAAAFLALPVRVEQCVGQWLELPEQSRLRVGESPETGALGVSAVIGERVWERQQKFRLVLGPVGLDDYERMLPGGESFARLVAMVRNYAGDQYAWEVRLVLRCEEIPSVRLGVSGRLGWTTWLDADARFEDAGDLYLEPLACA